MRTTDADVIMQRHMPMLTVPLFGEFVELAAEGQRMLVAKDGLWLEVKRAWVHLIWPIAQRDGIHVPAGSLIKKVDFAFKKLPKSLVDRFVSLAREASPRETGAVVTWDERTGELALVPTATIKSEVGHLRYEPHIPRPNVHVVMDLHSHGNLPAYYSPIDIEDTGAETVIAMVVGNLEDEDESMVARLFSYGLQIPLKL